MQVKASTFTKIIQLDKVGETAENDPTISERVQKEEEKADEFKVKKTILEEDRDQYFLSFLKYDESNGLTKILEFSTFPKNKTGFFNTSKQKFGRSLTFMSKKSNAEDKSLNHFQPAIGMNVVMNFKGFGFSFIDNKPQELLYVCMERLLMRYRSSTIENPAIGEKRFNTLIDMRLYNF